MHNRVVERGRGRTLVEENDQRQHAGQDPHEPAERLVDGSPVDEHPGAHLLLRSPRDSLGRALTRLAWPDDMDTELPAGARGQAGGLDDVPTMAGMEWLLLTIGVYGWSLEAWLSALGAQGTRTVLDVRQRRGVRGSLYPWANAVRLQSVLADRGLAYRHLRELAPTTELRQLQYSEDARQGVGKRSRVALAPEYVRRYTREILDRTSLQPVLDELNVGTCALLCVERDPEACHRSLIAARVAERARVRVSHLRPE